MDEHRWTRITLPFIALLFDHQCHQLKEFAAGQLNATACELKLIAITGNQRESPARDSEKLTVSEPVSTEAAV